VSKTTTNDKIVSLRFYKDRKLAEKLYDDLKHLAVLLSHQAKALEKYKKYKSAKRVIDLIADEVDAITLNTHHLSKIIEENKKGIGKK
jgi:hypothetical protein